MKILIVLFSMFVSYSALADIGSHVYSACKEGTTQFFDGGQGLCVGLEVAVDINGNKVQVFKFYDANTGLSLDMHPDYIKQLAAEFLEAKKLAK